MVNKKPSTGCAACRERHIKCDETRPGCKRCALKKITCPGYRDVKGVIFVNNTREIKSRHTKRTKSPASSSSDSDSQIATRSPTPTGLQLGDDSLAVAFFFSQYVSAANRGMLTSRGHLDHLIPMYTKSRSNSVLNMATAAIAYQALNVYHGGEAYKLQQAKYMADACQRLQEAIRDPVESVQDDTLMAVLCLDFSEHLSSRDSSRASCRAHVDGAAALIKHRPADAWKSDVARSLFAATRSNVLLQALWTGEAKGVIEFPKTDIGHINPVVDFQQILVRALTLEHEIMADQEPSTTEQARRRALASKIEFELDVWFSHMPTDWHVALMRPLSTSRRTIPMLQAAYTVGQWHCLKILALKLVCATTDDERIAEMIPLEVETLLQSLWLICEYLTKIVVVSPIDDMEAIEKTMDRSAGSVVVVSRGGASINVSKASNGHNYLINLLRWVLDELTEPRPRGAEHFAEHTESVDRLAEQWQAVLATYEST